MYIARTKKIDNITIVLGVTLEQIDNVETQKVIKNFIESSKENKIVLDKFIKVRQLTAENDEITKNVRKIIEVVSNRTFIDVNNLKDTDFTANELESIKNSKTRIDDNNKLIDSISKEIPKAQENLKKKKQELMKKHAIYFNIQDDDVRISDEVAINYKKKLDRTANKKQFVTIEGEIINDYRNKTFYGKIANKWEKLEIKRLNEEIDLDVFIERDNLTPNQLQEISKQEELSRIKNLSDEERQKEIDIQKDNALSQSVSMRSKLEIQGDKNALEKSQEFYQEQLKIIEEKYKK